MGKCISGCCTYVVVCLSFVASCRLLFSLCNIDANIGCFVTFVHGFVLVLLSYSFI